MTTLRQAAQQALEALVIGSDAAHEVAQNYHEAMAGYRPARHIAVDDDVRKIEAAIAALRAALAGGDKAAPTEPVQERNFCPRCGKQINDIHTCTPPLTEQGCDHCRHVLYAATKCKNCGRVTE